MKTKITTIEYISQIIKLKRCNIEVSIKNI